ncbi:MAG TPA: WD40 repeat domain-containing protein, partial [Gemmataceae bacterium]|nr:WD40 repeat domain-containing protein [Gemmataceae bacterium]
MKTRWIILFWVLAVITPDTWAQAPILPPGEKEPLVRLEAGGPTSFVTALTFSPDGKLLYAGGLDKVVRVWSLNEQGQFVSFPATYRVPIGPGLDGAINCIALSPDGTLLAVAGRGVFRQGAGFRQPGWVVPSIGAMNADMLRDQGMIYVFDTQTQAVRLLRGHQGAVLSMTFASADGQASPILVSAARERNEDANKYEGVIRAWNARTGEYLDGIREQPATDVRPGLTAWRTGKGIKDLGVGIAWGDGSLKVWNLGEGKPWSAEMDGEYDTALARPADSGKLLSGSIGRLRVWSYSPDTGLKAERAQATFASQDNVFLIPRAVVAAPSQVDQKPAHVAVVLRVFQEGTQDEYRLRLLDLDGLRGIAGLGDISLWKGRASQPVLAASSRGYLAISGNSDHSIHIYSVQNLLQNQTKPQILRSVGAAFRYVSFVTKGKELGLLLGETTKKKLGQAPREPLQGDQIFDFTKRPLTGDIREWQTAAPATNGWQARLAYADDQPVLPIYQGQGLIREIKLAKGMVVTDYALLSPRSPLDVPILAVAYHDLGQPWLVLYDGKTGQQIRQLTGHVDPISCLAFSPDGRLLASVAEDQTVCIWSLADLDKVFGKRGQLVGVAVKEQNDAVVVGKVLDDSPSRGQLAVGDVIEGIVANEKVRELKTSLDFYRAM